MAFPLLFPLAGAAIGAGIRYVPHIFRFFAPKVVTGANRLGQLIAKGAKHPSSIGAGFGTAMMLKGDTDLKKQNLQNMLKPYGPLMPHTAPKAEMPLGVDQQPPMPNALEEAPEDLKPKVDVPQAQPLETSSQTPPREPTDVEKFLQSNTYKFFQSDAYQKLKDLFAGMAESSSDGSGWDALASGVKRLNEGDKQRGQVNQTVEYLKSKGYSEEEARFIAGNKDALNAFLLQKVNGGYDARSKEEMDRLRETIELKNSEAISSNTLRDIERFTNYIEETGEWATGNSAAVQAKLGVPQHRDMSSLLDSIKNRIGIDRLETMRRYSRNGASGLGNLTEKELDILKSYLGEIKYNLGHKELLFRLKKIHEILGKMKSDVLSLLENGNIALTQENIDKVTSQSHSTGPQKGYNNQLPKMGVEEAASNGNITYFIDSSNGKVLVKEK
ncbi:hypothetical protein [Bartonella sp. AD13SXNS]|uniref:hypothetical protein n=1 Tax=Bartonella sp. AD13SXNS TaxID=3243462 RepID=UPI0035D11FF1